MEFSESLYGIPMMQVLPCVGHAVPVPQSALHTLASSESFESSESRDQNQPGRIQDKVTLHALGP